MRLGWIWLFAGCGFSATPITGDGGGGAIDAGRDAAVDAPLDVPPTGLPSPRKLVFDNAASASDLDDFPVLVAPTPATIDYAVVTDPMTQLRFVDAGGSDLKFEIEHWNPGGESAIWVEVPRIDGGSTTDHVFMHFGPGETGTIDPAAVWGAYELVVHLGGALADRSGNGHDATQVNTSASGGRIGGGTQFTGIGNQRVTFGSSTGLFDGWDRFSFELWIRPEFVPTLTQPPVLEKGGSVTLGRLRYQSLELVMQVDLHMTSNTNVYLFAPTSLNDWTHIMYTYDGSAVRLYRNGVQHATSGASNRNLVAATNAFFLGGTNPFVGKLDEFRISRVARSADWIRAQHLSMTRQFVTFTDP